MMGLIWRAWYYFRRGHGNYLSFFMSFGTFVVVAYQLALKNIPFLEGIFSNMLFFAFFFGFVYSVLAVIIGYKDIKKGSYNAESRIVFDNNPRYSELLETVKRIEEKLKV